jgi:hypothetical protein
MFYLCSNLPVNYKIIYYINGSHVSFSCFYDVPTFQWCCHNDHMICQCCSESHFLMPHNHSNKDINVMAWASNFPLYAWCAGHLTLPGWLRAAYQRSRATACPCPWPVKHQADFCNVVGGCLTLLCKGVSFLETHAFTLFLWYQVGSYQVSRDF